MILNVIMFKNQKIQAFTNPNFTDVEPDKAAKGLERAIIANFKDNSELVKSYENLDMFYIGTFDDEIGKFTACEPILLTSPRELILKLREEELLKAEKLKEVTKVTGSEVSN